MRVFKHIKHIYFTGIGGIGMSGLADILIESGYQVSGSDRMLTDITDYLTERGAKVYDGHDAQHMNNVDLLVYSSAIPEDNPERMHAKKSGIPQIRRAECWRSSCDSNMELPLQALMEKPLPHQCVHKS